MRETRRQSPKAPKNAGTHSQRAALRGDRRDLMHDDSGIGSKRRTEDDVIDEPAEEDGSNSNT